MNVRQVAAIARQTERDRIERRLTRYVRSGACTNCGQRAYRVGPYRICRNLGCKRLVQD